MTRLRDRAKFLIGRLAARAAPGLVREIEAGVQTGRHIRLKRWIVLARVQQALKRGDEEEIGRALMVHWRSEAANDFYDRFPGRFRDWYLGPHQAVVDEMARLARSRRFLRFVEIGCGDGRVLAHCAARMPEIPDFVGVDINRAIIARDRAVHAGIPRLRFVAAGAQAWLSRNAGPGTMLFSYGGVMEYFPRENLRRILGELAGRPGAAVALVEPVDTAHDLAHDPASHRFGPEHSFSHNHAALLAMSGFDILWRSEIRLDGIRWMMILAHVPFGA